MKASRASEHRSSGKKLIVYSSFIVVAIIAGVFVLFFASNLQTSSATGGEEEAVHLGPDTVNSGNPDHPVAAAPTPTPIPSPTIVQETSTSDHDRLMELLPETQFGEILTEGFLDLELPGNAETNVAHTWYTFQVDTATRDITLFFALFNESEDALTRTVRLDGYTQGSQLQTAEISVFYPDGPARVLNFDRDQGTITLTQRYQQPYGPSLFSPALRVALVNRDMVLQDNTGGISTKLQLDLSGLTDSERMEFQLSSPELVQDVLSEVQGLVNQIESKRAR